MKFQVPNAIKGMETKAPTVTLARIHNVDRDPEQQTV